MPAPRQTLCSEFRAFAINRSFFGASQELNALQRVLDTIATATAFRTSRRPRQEEARASVIVSISAGAVADHGLLYVEGQAFEDDAERLIQAASEGSLLDVLAVADRKTSESVM